MSFTRNIWIKISTIIPNDHEKKDKGAGFIEYAAVILLVGVISAAVLSSDIGSRVSQGITNSIERALSGGDGTPPEPTPIPAPGSN